MNTAPRPPQERRFGSARCQPPVGVFRPIEAVRIVKKLKPNECKSLSCNVAYYRVLQKLMLLSCIYAQLVGGAVG